MPAKAGTQRVISQINVLHDFMCGWLPAFAGMTVALFYLRSNAHSCNNKIFLFPNSNIAKRVG
jgi:hypothetical protein